MTDLWTYLEKAVQLYALNIVIAILIFVLGRWVAHAVVRFARRVMKRRNVDETLSKFFCSLLFALLMAVIIIAALGQLGIETTSLIAVIGAAGLAIGLALQGSLSNFASGVMLIIFRPFKVGDYVDAGGVSGVAEVISLFTTMFKTPDNKKVIVPNALITSGSITNYSAEDKRRIDLVYRIGYDNDIFKAKQIIQTVLAEDPRILADPAPTVGVEELAVASVNLAVRPWVRTTEYWDVYFALNERMKQRFEEENISMTTPLREVHITKQGI
jgi:small conductance mechanosensitive channel